MVQAYGECGGVKDYPFNETLQKAINTTFGGDPLELVDVGKLKDVKSMMDMLIKSGDRFIKYASMIKGKGMGNFGKVKIYSKIKTTPWRIRGSDTTWLDQNANLIRVRKL